jgi:hypothetical protein
MQSLPTPGSVLRIQTTDMVEQQRPAPETEGGHQERDQEDEDDGKEPAELTRSMCETNPPWPVILRANVGFLLR